LGGLAEGLLLRRKGSERKGSGWIGTWGWRRTSFGGTYWSFLEGL